MHALGCSLAALGRIGLCTRGGHVPLPAVLILVVVFGLVMLLGVVLIDAAEREVTV